MGTKQVRLDDDVYAKIADKKRDGESFSDAIDRLTTDWSLVDWAKKYNAETNDLEEAVAEVEHTDQQKSEEVLERMNVE